MKERVCLSVRRWIALARVCGGSGRGSCGGVLWWYYAPGASASPVAFCGAGAATEGDTGGAAHPPLCPPSERQVRHPRPAVAMPPTLPGPLPRRSGLPWPLTSAARPISVVPKPYDTPPMKHLRNSITFCVSVPVLSEKMYSTCPSSYGDATERLNRRQTHGDGGKADWEQKLKECG